MSKAYKITHRVEFASPTNAPMYPNYLAALVDLMTASGMELVVPTIADPPLVIPAKAKGT